MVIAAVLVSIHVIVSGQMIEDIVSTQMGIGFILKVFQTTKAFEDILKSLEWSRWNKENKKIYLIILANNIKPFKLQFSDSIALNYRLALGVIFFGNLFQFMMTVVSDFEINLLCDVVVMVY